MLGVLVVLVCVVSINSANGEMKATLWAPDEILLKEKYHGVVIVDTQINDSVTFDIITDNEEILRIITESVTIPKDKHHGLIEFETIGAGNAKIFAISQDVLLEQNINIVESADTPTELELILPSQLVNVLADENHHTGYVFLLNAFENPVTAKQNIPIALTSNGEIELLSKSVILEEGMHYVKFQFRAQGEGSISASAQNLLPDEAAISINDLDDIELQIAVGPDPIPTDSTGEIYFWLERDGKPYIPSHDVQVKISIDKSANLSFDSAMRGAIVLSPNTSGDRRATDSGAQEIITRTESQLSQDSQRTLIIKGGEHYGRLTAYSSFDAIDSITISGLAESISAGPDEETVKVSNIFSTSTEKSNNDRGTATQIFAFPDPAYKTAEIIVSSLSDEGPVMETDNEEFNIFSDNRLQLAKNIGTITNDNNYAIIKANVVDYGNAVIFAERNEAESEEITLETAGKYVKNPELDIVTLPVIFDREQDLFLISSSQEKIITDTNEEDGNLISITSRPSFDFEVIRESESIIAVRGTISESLKDEPEIHIASNAFTAQDTLEVYNPDRKMLVSLHPKNVYPHELFPIVNHIDDLNSNPVRKSMLQVSSVATMGTSDNMFYFNQTGTHDIIFYDKNAVPIKSTITVKGATVSQAISPEDQKPTIVTYVITVHDGQGSGTYTEDEEVTISASPIKDDFVLFKKNLVGWENLPYKDAEVTFEVDENLETRPIYQDDYSLLFVMGGSVGGIGAFVFIRNRKNGKENTKEKSDDDDILELLKD